MDDDAYRAMLAGLEYPMSTADLTVPQMEFVLEHLKRCGFKVRSKRATAAKTKAGTQPRSRAMSHYKQDRKIRAVWLLLHELGAIQNPSEQALAAYVHRITKVDALQWLSAAQSDRVIETMKSWAMRLLPGRVDAMALELSEATVSAAVKPTPEQLDDVAYMLQVARKRETFDPTHAAYESLKSLLSTIGVQQQ